MIEATVCSISTGPIISAQHVMTGRTLAYLSGGGVR